MTKIFVFERPDGSRWADYSEEHAKRFKIIATHEWTTRGDLEALIRQAEMPRVRALADRALKEFLARGQQPESIPAPIAPEVRKRSLWGRLSWLLTGA